MKIDRIVKIVKCPVCRSSMVAGEEYLICESLCPRCGGTWGDDLTCPNCTNIDGTPKEVRS